MREWLWPYVARAICWAWGHSRAESSGLLSVKQVYCRRCRRTWQERHVLYGKWVRG